MAAKSQYFIQFGFRCKDASSRFVKYVPRESYGFSPPESSGDLSLRNSDRIESGMLGKYINGGSPQNGEVWRLTGSGVHDTSLLAHCWRFLLLYALVSGYLLRLRIAMDVVYGKESDVEFSIHCERNIPTAMEILAT